MNLNLKTHYEVTQYGCELAKEEWTREGLVHDKVKFCDGLMLGNTRELDFTRDTDFVTCKRCQKKINSWYKNGFDLPS